MVRLFSALDLPASIRAELAERLAEVRAQVPDLTWSPPERWHITLGFYGDREHADRRGAWFRQQAAGLAGPRLRLRAAGRFPGVLWVGVNPAEPADRTALHAMAGALIADNDAYDFTAHVTIARWRRGGDRGQSAIRALDALADFAGAWWTVRDVVLYRSDQQADGPVYTALDRVPLTGKQR